MSEDIGRIAQNRGNVRYVQPWLGARGHLFFAVRTLFILDFFKGPYARGRAPALARPHTSDSQLVSELFRTSVTPCQRLRCSRCRPRAQVAPPPLQPHACAQPRRSETARRAQATQDHHDPRQTTTRPLQDHYSNYHNHATTPVPRYDCYCAARQPTPPSTPASNRTRPPQRPHADTKQRDECPLRSHTRRNRSG